MKKLFLLKSVGFESFYKSSIMCKKFNRFWTKTIILVPILKRGGREGVTSTNHFLFQGVTIFFIRYDFFRGVDKSTFPQNRYKPFHDIVKFHWYCQVVSEILDHRHSNFLLLFCKEFYYLNEAISSHLYI